MSNIEKPKHIKKITKAFTRLEQKQFMNECQHSKYKDYFLLLLFQGFRRSELLALESTDINFHNNTISINKTVNDQGKTTKPKTNTSIRTVPIFKDSVQILNEYKNKQGRLFKYSRSSIQNEFTKILKNTISKILLYIVYDTLL